MKTAISVPEELFKEIDSVVNISRAVTLDKTDRIKKIGSLSPARVRQIVDGFRLLIEPRDIQAP